MEAISSYSEDIKVWIEFGTLLGAYWDGTFIAHDCDIDLGIYEEDISEDLIRHIVISLKNSSRREIISKR